MCSGRAIAVTAQPVAPIAIRNARIVPVSGAPIDGGTIVLVNGLIKSVGVKVDVPAEAVVIDGTGLTVYPGLIDALTDLGMAPTAAAGPAAGAAPGGGPGARAPALAHPWSRRSTGLDAVAAGRRRVPRRRPEDRDLAQRRRDDRGDGAARSASSPARPRS